MFNILVSIVVASQFAQFTTHDNGDEVWLLDKNTVHVGGCVAVILEAPASVAAQYQLGIGDAEPVRLVDSLGFSVRWNDRTVVLLSHDLRHAEHVQSTQEAEELVRVPPIFREPGVVPLRLVLNDELVGALSVEVIAAPASAEDCVDRMFPTVNRRASLDERERASAWARLATVSNVGLAGDMGPLLQMLREELPVIARHPDWAETAEVLVGRVEARDHFRALVNSSEGQPLALKDSVLALPPLPELVNRCIEAKPKSQFGQAVQDDVRAIVTKLRMLDAERRGEDPLEVLRAADVDR